jgi:hypothetical protein
MEFAKYELLIFVLLLFNVQIPVSGICQNLVIRLLAVGVIFVFSDAGILDQLSDLIEDRDVALCDVEFGRGARGFIVWSCRRDVVVLRSRSNFSSSRLARFAPKSRVNYIPNYNTTDNAYIFAGYLKIY